MRIVVQRVSRASVRVEGRTVASIGRGLLLLVGLHGSDGEAELTWMAAKCARLRIFPDEEGKMNRSLLDIGGEALAVSQFTLYGDLQKGTRPSFTAAAHPSLAEPLYQRFRSLLANELGLPPGEQVPGGIFGAHMEVDLVNDGPVTILLERGSS